MRGGAQPRGKPPSSSRKDGFKVEHTKDCIVNAEHAALRDITKPTSRYKRVVVRDEVYPGADVVSVFGPDQESPAWMIVFADGTKIHTTHPVTVVENAQ